MWDMLNTMPKKKPHFSICPGSKNIFLTDPLWQTIISVTRAKPTKWLGMDKREFPIYMDLELGLSQLGEVTGSQLLEL